MAAKSSSKDPVERVALPANFDGMLCAAEAGVGDDWERQFLKEQRERFERWGDTMFLSPKQLTILQRIASKAPAGEDII
jgi:hypothetical protein